MDSVGNMLKNLPQILEEITTIGILLQMIMGILNCFFGYHLLKVWTSLCGFVFGIILGYVLGKSITENTGILIAILLVTGLLMGVLAYRIYLAGIFILGWIMTVLGMGMLGKNIEINSQYATLYLVVAIIAGIIVGSLLVKFSKPAIILFTGIQGSYSFITGVRHFVAWNQGILVLIGILVAVLGILWQFFATKKE